MQETHGFKHDTEIKWLEQTGDLGPAKIDGKGLPDVIKAIVEANQMTLEDTIKAVSVQMEVGDCRIDWKSREVIMTRSSASIELRIAIVAHFDQLLAHFQPKSIAVPSHQTASAQLTLM